MLKVLPNLIKMLNITQPFYAELYVDEYKDI